MGGRAPATTPRAGVSVDVGATWAWLGLCGWLAGWVEWCRKQRTVCTRRWLTRSWVLRGVARPCHPFELLHSAVQCTGGLYIPYGSCMRACATAGRVVWCGYISSIQIQIQHQHAAWLTSGYYKRKRSTVYRTCTWIFVFGTGFQQATSNLQAREYECTCTWTSAQ
jgi:hypothetical protein